MHNPLRSEEEAFRWLVTILGGAIVVIVAAVVFRPAVGAVVAAALVALGVVVVWRGSRGSERLTTQVAERGGERFRILVVANETMGGRALLDQIRARAGERDAEVLLVTPALTSSHLQHWTSDIDGAVVQAEQRLNESLAALEREGFDARGDVGDSDPNTAITDALLEFGADEVIISTHPPGRSHWLERQVVERAREEVDLPVTHVVVDVEGEQSP